VLELPRPVERALNAVDPRLLGWVWERAKSLPFVRRRLQKEYDELLVSIERELKPYRGVVPSYAALPAQGRDRAELLAEMRSLKDREEARWKDGFVSGAVYHGDDDHVRFLVDVYALHSQSNPLHADVWPSASKYEAEIVAMTASLMGARESGAPVCGTVTSGGTESILLAMKTYRDQARARRRVRAPEIVVPTTVHAAFEKAGQYFRMKVVKVPVGPDFRADVAATRAALNRNTVAVVGSAPSFPHGVIDPIEELSELARARGCGFHVDACLGGFVLPFAARLGWPVPTFDFRLPGVTSLSADTHKFGYAAKGTSVILYRDPELRRFQFYTTTDWPGGLYFTPTFAGSRPGGLSAACWAAMVALGEDGYRRATERILRTADTIKRGIRETVPELRILGDPLFVIAFASDELDVYRVFDRMTAAGWSLNGLHRPSCVHLCVTLRHTQDGVAERFLDDLRAAVAFVKAHPSEQGGMAPVYGLAATLPVRGIVRDLLERYIDVLYRV
jgi:glutamate/tyrosine decarboxylase-like PLP-dependent enzyme